MKEIDMQDGPLKIIAIISTGLTYAGASSAWAEDTIGHLMAAGFSVGSGVFIWWYWTTALNVFSKAETLSPRKRAWVLAATLFIATLGLPFIGALSTGFNMGGLVGEKAMEQHQYHHIANASTAVSEAYATSHDAKMILADLEVAAFRFKNDAILELKTGKVTGVPGPGAAQTALDEVGKRFGKMADLVREHLEGSKRAHAIAQQLVGKMRDVAKSNLTLEQRNASVANLSGELGAVMADMSVRPLGGTLSRLLQALPDLASENAYQLSAKPKLAARQREALRKVRAHVTDTATALAPMAQRLADQSKHEDQRFVPVPGIRAVFLHASDFAIPIMAAAALDFGPWFVLLWWFVLLFVRDDDERRRDEIENITVSELLSSLMGLAQASKFKPAKVEKRNAEFFGTPTENDDE